MKMTPEVIFIIFESLRLCTLSCLLLNKSRILLLKCQQVRPAPSLLTLKDHPNIQSFRWRFLSEIFIDRDSRNQRNLQGAPPTSFKSDVTSVFVTSGWKFFKTLLSWLFSWSSCSSPCCVELWILIVLQNYCCFRLFDYPLSPLCGA